MRVRNASAAVLLCLAVPLGACGGKSSPTGPPKCSDSSAKAERLLAGCYVGSTLHQGISQRCVGDRTLYSVPGGYAWGYGGQKVHPGALTTDELSRCMTGS